MTRLRSSLSARLVWGVWAVLTLSMFVFVARYGWNCPFMDEWDFLPVLSGQQPWLPWLFEAHVEHRYPVGRAIYLLLFFVTHDLRSAMFVNVVGLSLTAALFQSTARQLRGFTSWTDLVFPLIFLHPGHWENVLMSYQVNFVTSLVVVAVLVRAVFRNSVDRAPSRLITIGICAVMLTGLGSMGVVYAGASSLILAIEIILATRRGRLPIIATLLGLVAVTCLVFYLLSRPDSPYAEVHRGPGRLMLFALTLLGMAFGPGSVLLEHIPSLVMLILILGTIALLIRRVEWSLVGPIVLFGAAGFLVLGMTWARGWAGAEAALASRYAMILACGSSITILTALRLNSPSTPWVPRMIGLTCLTALVCWPFNAYDGRVIAIRLDEQFHRLEQDVTDGIPDQYLTERYDWSLWRFGRADDRIQQARQLRFAPFRNSPSEPLRLRRVALPEDAIGLHGGIVTIPVDPSNVALRIEAQCWLPMDTLASVNIRVRPPIGPEQVYKTIVPGNIPFALIVRIPAEGCDVQVEWPDELNDFDIITIEILRRE